MLVTVATFAIAAALLVILPGPDTLVFLRSLVRDGRGAAVRTLAGTLTGLAIWVSVAVLGLTAVLRASHDAYLALRVIGAAYLIWLGFQALRPSRRSAAAADAADAAERPPARMSLSSGFVAGLATDLLNPKVGIFFVTFLPTFIAADQPVAATSLLLGGIYIAETAVYFIVLLGASRAVTRWMSTERIRRRIDRTMGAVFIAFGLRLVLE
ncbi:MAG: rhtB [Pseudonocardiales bacterium]|nr:rhtB [Pseudonocardiales bacterium]